MFRPLAFIALAAATFGVLAGIAVAGNPVRNQARQRDGSCTLTPSSTGTSQTQPAGTAGQQLRKRDGSCMQRYGRGCGFGYGRGNGGQGGYGHRRGVCDGTGPCATGARDD